MGSTIDNALKELPLEEDKRKFAQAVQRTYGKGFQEKQGQGEIGTVPQELKR
jgi:hypothetical protein